MKQRKQVILSLIQEMICLEQMLLERYLFTKLFSNVNEAPLCFCPLEFQFRLTFVTRAVIEMFQIKYLGFEVDLVKLEFSCNLELQLNPHLHLFRKKKIHFYISTYQIFELKHKYDNFNIEILITKRRLDCRNKAIVCLGSMYIFHDK